MNFRIGNKNLSFIQVKSSKGTQRIVLLEVGLEDLPICGLKVRIMLDLYFDFPAKDKIFLS